MKNQIINFHHRNNNQYNTNNIFCFSSLNATVYPFLFVAAGMLDVGHPGQRRTFESKMEHEKYNPKDSYRNDIALVKVNLEHILSGFFFCIEKIFMFLC